MTGTLYWPIIIQ